MITSVQTVPEAEACLMSTSASDLTFELVLDDTFAAHRVGLTRAQVEAVVTAAGEHGIHAPGVHASPL